MIYGYRKGATRLIPLAISTEQAEGETPEVFAERKAKLEAVAADVRLRVKNAGRRAALRLSQLLASDEPDRYERIVNELLSGAPGLVLLQEGSSPLDATRLEGDELVDALDAVHLLEAAAVAAVVAQQPTFEQKNFLG